MTNLPDFDRSQLSGLHYGLQYAFYNDIPDLQHYEGGVKAMGGDCRCGRCHTNFASATPTFCPLIIAGHTNNTADYALAMSILRHDHPCMVKTFTFLEIISDKHFI